jgi:hypothetical protein
VNRLARLVLLACAVTLVLPASGLAAQRMFLGFQDDAGFRFRPDRGAILDRAKNAHATLVRIAVVWSQAAPKRPAQAANPFDPAYKLDDVDEFVRNAQNRGLEPMLGIWGTPKWANGGKGANRLPTRLADLTAFTTALASRYSGRYPGYPFVKFYGVWNEPNLNQFLSPQFDRKGRSVGPALYAKLYAAAYTGIKRGNKLALVGMGETSARGRDKHVRGLQDTHSPGRFVQLVAKANPRLKFDAYAHHPYPTDPRQSPDQVVRWPNVGLKALPKLEQTLNKAFKRKSTPIWITEYGHITTPDPRGVSYQTQAAYLQRAIAIARGYSFVDMFVWFALHDDPGDPWRSGLIAEDDTLKPAFFTFADLAFQLDARNPIVVVKAGQPNPVVRIAAREIAARSPAGSRIGVDERVIQGDSLVAHAQPETTLAIDGWMSVPLMFTPEAGRTYYIQVEANDIHGTTVSRLVTLVARA